MMRVVNLYSGSKGNATLIEAGGATVLIDAGRSARALCTALASVGSSIEAVDAIFLTHEHSDHTAALEVLLRRHPIPVHVTETSARRLRGRESFYELLVTHPPMFEVAVAGLTVRSFLSPHDSAMCVGYRLVCDEGEIGYATDVGFVSDTVREGLGGCSAVVLECNHDPDMLRWGRYPAELKERIASREGHLSNPDCAAFAAELIEGGTRHLMLAHLSEENNTPDTAYAELCGSIGFRLREYGGDVSLAIARPNEVTEMKDLGTLSQTLPEKLF